MTGRWRELGATGAAVLLALVLLLPDLGRAPLDDPGEGQQAEIARELWVSGDLLTLRLNGVPYVDKPPLLYWLQAAAFAVWGPTEWSARLPSVLGAALAVAGTAWLGARLLGPAWGLAAGAALVSSLLFVVFGRYVRPETLFTAGVQWGFTGLLLAGRGGRRAYAVAGCVGLGIAGLAKDPLGLLGPLAAIAAARGLAGRVRPVSAWLPAAGVAAMLVIGLGWYAVSSAREPGYLWYTAVDNHLLNVIRARQFPDEDVPLSALEFLAVAGAGGMPWTVAAALMVLAMARARAWSRPDEIPWTALGLWAVGLFALFAASPFKLPHYGVPSYPALALLAARWWRDRAAARPRLSVGLHAAGFAAVAALLGAAAVSDGRLFNEIVMSAADEYTRKEALVGELPPVLPWSALAPILGRTAAVFGAAAAVLAGLAWWRAPRAALGVILSAMLFCMTSTTRAMDVATGVRSVAGLARDIARLDAAVVLIHEGPIENSGAVEFYSGRRPVLLEARRSVLGFGSTLPDGAGAFWDVERFRREWAAGRPLALLTPRDRGTSVVRSLPPDTVQVIRRDNGRTLYRNASGPPGPAPSAPAPAPVRGSGS